VRIHAVLALAATVVGVSTMHEASRGFYSSRTTS
jgi:hypothetical protein